MTVTSRMVPPSFATVSINRAYVNVDSIGSARKILARMLGGLYTQSVDGNCSSRVASVQLSKDALSSSETSPATRSNAMVLARARAAREHPTIAFRPVVRSVRPQLPAKSLRALKTIVRGDQMGLVPFVCEVLRSAHTRPTIARKFEKPPATGPQFGAAINRRGRRSEPRAPWQPTQPWTRRPSAQQN